MVSFGVPISSGPRSVPARVARSAASATDLVFLSTYALSRSFHVHGRFNRTVGVVIDIVALESAGTRAARVGNGDLRAVVLGHHPQVEIHQALPGDTGRGCTDSMCGVTDGAGKSGLDVESMLAEAGVRH